MTDKRTDGRTDRPANERKNKQINYVRFYLYQPMHFLYTDVSVF